ncbi:PAS domain S-box-containing protein/diguanylate cyclase (GGDEF)-like protein [Vreelandella songnenensis]|uniref:PAS domain S-box-containing protein/diguanylate cyclase (GGDEF)-like protein n=1 Tax=Vreelandella songnenensis TaxID=1176243 RepID=A0A2T0V8S4_9GAMM|nr:diguanylate cyclase [Halomonas songnenensis]PRY66531.1 PAS domain S-box-containing protein/diguanylate cyclase (GGDEF)-like protein [Halomonas songnenensis]
MSCPIPPNEKARLAALYELALLDTPNEPVFDRITRLATKLLSVPVATVSLMDAKRQWFKARLGLSMREVPRDIAFCAYPVMEAAPLIVEDACKDSRFAQNPLVTESQGIRFYAGIPLKNSQGLVLGTLCVTDTRPRELSEMDFKALLDLADIVTDEIKLRERVVREQKEKEASQRALSKLHHSLEAQIEQRTHELRLVIETAYDGYASIDAHNRVLDWNLAAATMFGWTRDEALGQPISTLMLPDGVPSDAEKAPVTTQATRRDGGLLPVEVRCKSLAFHDRQWRSLFIHDISERQQLERLRDQQAREDVLTKLANRRALDERLPEAMARARRLKKPLAVLFLDLDGFKRVNDNYGHGVGDELLREVAKRLTASARETDFVARWAGDEFVLILEGVEPEAITPLAQKIIRRVEQPLTMGEATLAISTSIGVAMYLPDAPETAQQLVKRADVAMYEAKRAGKAQVRIA